jgi:internalin A
VVEANRINANRKRQMNKFFLSLFASLLCVSFAADSGAADGIFPDKNLAAVVRQYVFEKRNNDEPIVEEDVVNISTITGKRRGIKDLTGLEKCRSLASLDLEDNKIENIESLAKLTNIQSLDLAKNTIEDIKPIAGLTKLQYVKLDDNRISDISPLAALENARSVYLANNRIKDLKPLRKLTKAWSLYLNGNKIEDISVLAHLKNVDTLDLRDNQVKDIAVLKSLNRWKFLFLENNKITDLTPLVEMGKKDRADSPNFSLFWQIYLTGNPLSAESRETQLEELKKVAKEVVFEASEE